MPLLLLLGALLGCAEARQPWPVYTPPPEGELDPSLPLASELEAEGAIPRAVDYPPPMGARAAWLDAQSSPPGPSRRLSALAADRVGDGRLLASLEADVDGDGRDELLVLSRAADGTHHFEIFAPAQGRTLSRRRIEARIHEGRPCHLEVRLIGVLETAAGARPLLWRDRGLGCARFEGGGFERHLLVDVPSLPTLVEIPLARMVHLGPGAVDGYDGAVWRSGDEGEEVLFARGIAWSRRICAHPDAGFWVEELAFRRLNADGAIDAWRGGRALPLPEGILPPELLRSHLAPCN